MGGITNIILFIVFFSFIVFTLGAASGGTWENYIQEQILSRLDITNWGSGIVGVTAATLIAASIVFPNPYTLFAGVAILFFEFLTVIDDMFDQVIILYGLDSASEANLLLFLTVSIKILLSLAITAWYRGIEI